MRYSAQERRETNHQHQNFLAILVTAEHMIVHNYSLQLTNTGAPPADALAAVLDGGEDHLDRGELAVHAQEEDQAEEHRGPELGTNQRSAWGWQVALSQSQLTWGQGIWARAWGKTTNTRPGPSATTSSTRCSQSEVSTALG